MMEMYHNCQKQYNSYALRDKYCVESVRRPFSLYSQRVGCGFSVGENDCPVEYITIAILPNNNGCKETLWIMKFDLMRICIFCKLILSTNCRGFGVRGVSISFILDPSAVSECGIVCANSE